MAEWKKASDSLPNDGDVVDIRLVSGPIVRRVQFAGGRFWKVRKGNGGHAYNVDAWREIVAPKRSKPDERPERDPENQD